MRLSTGRNNLTAIGLAFVAGTGLILMGVALAIGVVEGDAADGDLIAGLFAGGLALFGVGVGAWMAYTQPFKNFDDIGVAQYTGHHDGDDDH